MKTLFLSILLLVATVAQGDTQVKLRADKFKLNRAQPGAMQDAQLGDRIIDKSEHTLTAVFDFSVLGGAVSTVDLKDSSQTGILAKLPKGAIIRDCIINTITPTTGGLASALAIGFSNVTASVALLKASTAVSSYTGLVACTPVGSAATAIKLLEDVTVSATIANTAVTAGKLYIIISYELSDVQ